MQLRKCVSALLLLLLGVSVLSGCEREKTPGQHLDDAIKKTGEVVEEAGLEIQETTQKEQ